MLFMSNAVYKLILRKKISNKPIQYLNHKK